MTFRTLLYEKTDSVAWITLNRPRVLNVYNIQMRDDLTEVFSAIRDDAEVRVMVLRGAGRAFCAGADLTEFGTAPSPTAARRIRFARDVWGVLDALPLPTIASMHGFAFGSGVELALFCDLRIAAEGTVLGFPEARLGMIPAAGGSVTLPRATGAGPALDLLLTGRRVDAVEALRLGVLSRVVPDADLARETDTLVRELLALDDRAMRAIKTSVRRGFDLTLAQAVRLEMRMAAGLRPAASTR
jgi:enoyl-CoA hydratase/carnithine racemase